MTLSAYADQIDAHYSATWGQPIQQLRWGHGPIDELPLEFRVSLYGRTAEMGAYATRCMSQPGDATRVEVHVLSRLDPQACSAYVEVLTAVAHYHRRTSPLGLGHTVNFGVPLAPGSSCTYGLLSLPYLDGPDLEWMGSPRVRFLWLIPVTKEEVEYKKRYGMERLEDRFEASGFDYLDLHRDSVV